MNQYDHLQLRRAEPHEPRWKPRPPARSPREYQEFGLELAVATEKAIEHHKIRSRPVGVDPALILRVQTTGYVDEDQWRLAGFTVVESSADRVLLLFSDNEELSEFSKRVEAYRTRQVKKETQINPPYVWLEAIIPGSVSGLGPEDRVGRALQELRTAGGLQPDITYSFDIELWDLGSRDRNDLKLAELQKFVQQRGGRMPDRYARDGLVMARVLLAGSALEEMLTIPSIATVDLPPRATLLLAEIDNTMLDNLPNVKSPEPDAPRICVVDSGLTTGHPLLSTAVGEAMVASSSLTSPLDDNGHGTFVAGIAVYGNIEQCRQNLDFTPKFWIDSARVTNAHGEFDNERLIPTQMREAITYFADLGCRIFNISLGDRKSPYLGGKPSAWADVLDNLAHERDILIVVSAGNYEHDALDDVEPIAVLTSTLAFWEARGKW